MTANEQLVPLPRRVRPAGHVRGTLLGSSLHALRERGLEAQYYERLPEEHREDMMALVAMSWVEVPLALAHYRTMQALISDPIEQRAAGMRVGDRIQKSYLSTVIAALRATGAVTPRRLLARMPTIWARMFRGGAVGVVDVGPKDVEVTATGVALFEVPYFRHGWEGVWESGLGLSARKVYVTARDHGPDRMTIRVAWV